MAKVLQFKKPTPAQKHKGKTLCKSGFHSWQLLKEPVFDSRQGRLVTVFQCKRCGARKVRGISRESD